MGENFNNLKRKIETIMAAVLGAIIVIIGLTVAIFSKIQSPQIEPVISQEFVANADTYAKKNTVSFDGVIEAGTGAVAANIKVTAAPGVSDTEPVIDDSGFIFPDSDTRELTVDDILNNIGDLGSCLRAMNELYARHGYEFREEDNPEDYQYFNSLPWYRAMPKTDANGAMANFSYTESFNWSALEYYRSMMGW